MRMLIFLLLCSFFAAHVPASAWCAPPYELELEQARLHFEAFIQEYNKSYTNENEKQARFLIFKDNLEEVNRMNKELDTTVFGITQFMDLTLEEFTNSYTGSIKPDNYKNVLKTITDKDIFSDKDAPESYDWREFNVVTSVKNQNDCNAGYAFSAVGNVEGQYAMKYKQLIDMSPQQVVDCGGESLLCSGGSVFIALGILNSDGGSETEADYPYTGVKGKCQLDKTKFKANVTNFIAYKYPTQEDVKQLLYENGPLSISVRGSSLKSYYKTGSIIPDKSCTGENNQDVLLVGYGTENGNPYWIVKNSWGESWGDKGYFKIQRDEGADSCGMMTDWISHVVIA